MKMEPKVTSFLGRGWSFPPTFRRESASVDMLEDAADIASSMEILLGTAIGERIMEPKYGCNMRELLFEPLNNTMQNYLKSMVKQAILLYEPRIKLNDVILDMDAVNEGRVTIHVDYTIIATNSRQNRVYPFFFVK
jgi:uncharacterized protein